MATKSDVENFLRDFAVKARVFDMLFVERTNPKNAETLLQLEMSPAKRRAIIDSLACEDYIGGPLDDKLYGNGSLWVFGKSFKNQELYIKVSLGRENSPVVCTSFHLAEYPLSYPFK